jgi:hypothetical protein
VSKVQEKRTKLTATFLNSIATVMVVAGAVVPFAAFTYELPGVASGQTIILVGVSLVLMTRRGLGGMAMKGAGMGVGSMAKPGR